jgi:RNA polymerase subunit RPABC4/transcription elongation factor Spt4
LNTVHCKSKKIGFQGASRIPGIKKKRQTICPRCKKTVPAKTVFCEFCGARVTHPPACTLCGTLLAPDSRFCPSCGAPVTTGTEPSDVHGDPAGLKDGSAGKQSGEHAGSVSAPPGSAPDAGTQKLPDIPGESPVDRATSKSTGKRKGGRIKRSAVTTLADTETEARPLVSRIPVAWIQSHKYQVLILIAALVIAGVAAVGIPKLPALFSSSTTGADSLTEGGLSTLGSSAGSDLEPGTTAVTAVPTVISLTPGQTQVPPDNLLVYFQAERDPTSRIVTVSFNGGKGQAGVRDVFVRLTRSDGQVLTGTFKPLAAGSGVELQGTEKVDRVEVIVNYHTGAAYTVIDRTFEWKKQL